MASSAAPSRSSPKKHSSSDTSSGRRHCRLPLGIRPCLRTKPPSSHIEGAQALVCCKKRKGFRLLRTCSMGGAHPYQPCLSGILSQTFTGLAHAGPFFWAIILLANSTTRCDRSDHRDGGLLKRIKRVGAAMIVNPAEHGRIVSRLTNVAGSSCIGIVPRDKPNQPSLTKSGTVLNSVGRPRPARADARSKD